MILQSHFLEIKSLVLFTINDSWMVIKNLEESITEYKGEAIHNQLTFLDPQD